MTPKQRRAAAIAAYLEDPGLLTEALIWSARVWENSYHAEWEAFVCTLTDTTGMHHDEMMRTRDQIIIAHANQYGELDGPPVEDPQL